MVLRYPLTIFSSFLNLYMYHFFLPLFFPPANPTGNFYDYGQTMFRIMSAWKSPIELSLTRNGLVDKDWGDYYFSAK
jgi:hypothetical protein